MLSVPLHVTVWGTTLILDKTDGRTHASPINRRFQNVVHLCKNVLIFTFVSRSQANIVGIVSRLQTG